MRRMKRNTVKKIILIILSAVFIFSLKTNSFAIDNFENYEVVKVASSVIDTEIYKPNKDLKTGETKNAEELVPIGNTIVGILQIAGSIISVIVLAVIGIKYMMGSVEEKAEYKKTMLPYVIGAVMVFGISNLLKILIGIISDLVG